MNAGVDSIFRVETFYKKETPPEKSDGVLKQLDHHVERPLSSFTCVRPSLWPAFLYNVNTRDTLNPKRIPASFHFESVKGRN